MLGSDSMLSPARLEVGLRLDRYELLYALAEGGMATVWLARMHGKRGFKKLVVLKTIKPAYSEDERFQEMFLDEARIASGIQHPNVAQIIDLGEWGNVLYLAMEWVDGESLARIRREVAKNKAKFPLGVVLRIVADLCAGLHAAHELKDDDGNALGVVHRDVSPHNVMIAATGAVKVIDFGIAKARNRATAETSAGFLKGKIAYMSPEQAAGEPIDRRTDVWAAGVCLYELLTGKLPYDADGQTETLKLIVSGRPPVPLRPDVPEPVREIVKQALAFARDKRFATCLDMQRAIEAAMAQIPAPCTPAEVATFVEEHMAARTKARQKMVATALEAARIRAESAGEPSSVPSVASGVSAITTGAEIVGLPPSEVSQTTIGSAGSSAVLSAAAPASPRKSGVMGLAIAGAAIVLLGVGGFFMLRGKREEPAKPAAVVEPKPAKTTPESPSPAPPSAEPSEPPVETAAAASSSAPTPTPTVAAAAPSSSVPVGKPTFAPPPGYSVQKKPAAPPTTATGAGPKPPKPGNDDDF